jgi:hypothetical protein
MDSRYTYLNAVLDANPSVVRLVADNTVWVGGVLSDYTVATGPVPAGEQSIPGRVTVEAADPSDGNCRGYDAAGTLVALFRTS